MRSLPVRKVASYSFRFGLVLRLANNKKTKRRASLSWRREYIYFQRYVVCAFLKRRGFSKEWILEPPAPTNTKFGLKRAQNLSSHLFVPRRAGEECEGGVKIGIINRSWSFFGGWNLKFSKLVRLYNTIGFPDSLPPPLLQNRIKLKYILFLHKKG